MISINVQTSYGIDRYILRKFAVFIPVDMADGNIWWSKVPQPFTVFKHILMRKGAYKHRKIYISIDSMH